MTERKKKVLKFAADNARIISVLIVFGVGGGVAALVHHNSLNNAGTGGYYGSVPKATASTQPTQTDVSPAPTTSTAPATSTSSTSTPKPTQTVPNNDALCNNIAAQEKSDLDSLNSQITYQLQIMKTIIGNSSLDNEILSRGGSLSQIIGQSQITESFNQASDTATTLINQYSADKSHYQDQMLGLLNGNSPGCSSILNSQLNP
jgi:hypothetical protein